MPDPTPSLPLRRRFSVLRWLLILLPVGIGALALGLALVVRYVWIEPTAMGLACDAVPAPWWCALRTGVIFVHEENGWGLAALAAGVIAVIFRLYPLALVGMAVGLIGLVLYNAGLAAVGLLAALMVIIRR